MPSANCTTNCTDKEKQSSRRRPRVPSAMGVSRDSWESWSGTDRPVVAQDTVEAGKAQNRPPSPPRPPNHDFGPRVSLSIFCWLEGSNGSVEAFVCASPRPPMRFCQKSPAHPRKFYLLPSTSVRQPDRVDIILILASFEDNIDPADHCIAVPPIRPAQWCQIHRAPFAFCQVGFSSSCASSNDC